MAHPTLGIMKPWMFDEKPDFQTKPCGTRDFRCLDVYSLNNLFFGGYTIFLTYILTDTQLEPHFFFQNVHSMSVTIFMALFCDAWWTFPFFARNGPSPERHQLPHFRLGRSSLAADHGWLWWWGVKVGTRGIPSGNFIWQLKLANINDILKLVDLPIKDGDFP